MSEEELELLSNFKGQICRDNCEERNACNDCYIDFEQVKAVEHLLRAYRDLQQRINKACKFIIEAYYKEHNTPIENLCLKNCTYDPSLVALGILQSKEME